MGGYQPPPDPLSSFLNGIGGYLLLALGIFILIILLVREILCWYWKINERLDVMYDIKAELAKTNHLLRSLIQRIDPISHASPAPVEIPLEAPASPAPIVSEYQARMETPIPAIKQESQFVKYLLLSCSWLKSKSESFIDTLIANQKSVIIITILVLVIGACLSVLSIFAWMYIFGAHHLR